MTIDPDLDIEYQLREFLLADADVASVVAARIFPAPAPQNVPGPFVTFQRTSTDRVYSNDGYAGLAGALLQIDCWSDAPEYAGSYVEAKRVAQAVRNALNGYRGMMGPLRVQETTIETEHDLFEAQDHTRRVSIDFRLWFEEEHEIMGAWVKLAGGSLLTPASYLDFALPTGFVEYEVALYNVKVALDPGNNPISLALSQDGGATFMCDATHFDTYSSVWMAADGGGGTEVSSIATSSYNPVFDGLMEAQVGGSLLQQKWSIWPGDSTMPPIVSARHVGLEWSLGVALNYMGSDVMHYTLNPAAIVPPQLKRVNYLRFAPYGNGDINPPTSGNTMTAASYVLTGLTQ